MRHLILEALRYKPRSIGDLVLFVLLRKEAPYSIHKVQSEVQNAIKALRNKGQILYCEGWYRKIDRDLQEWYYKQTGAAIDQMKKTENITTDTPTPKQLADLYTKYHLKRLNLTPTSTKQK